MPTHKLTVKDIQLNVSITGQGSPLLLLNGLGGLIRTFGPLRDELVDYTTITLDVPGVGKTNMPRWPMRLSSHADVIAEMLKQLGIDQVDVFGVSWGGALAQEFALRYPRMVRRADSVGYICRPGPPGKACRYRGFFCQEQEVQTAQKRRLA